MASDNTSETDEVCLSVTEGVATIVLNRPDSLNAFSTTMVDEFVRALDRVDGDDDVRAVVVTGAGRAFSAGADLSKGAAAFTHSAANPAVVTRDRAGIISMRIMALRKPTIAAINGPAFGLGASMTLPMDIRLASEHAKIGFVFARRGIVPDGAASWFLPRLVGPGKAAEWMLTGRVISAAAAHAAGLVADVHAPDDLLPAATAVAREIADNCSPVSLAITRQLLWQMLTMPHPMGAHRIESRAIAWCAAGADAREGIAAYRERRAAAFPLTVSRDLPDFFTELPTHDFDDTALMTR